MQMPRRLELLFIFLLVLGVVYYLYFGELPKENTIKATERGPVFDDYVGYPNSVPQLEWLRKDPFAFWQDKHLYKGIDDLNVKEGDITRATHWNEKEPACRAQNLVTKVQRGQPVKMIVIGGSNSAGGGITNHMMLYHQLFTQWWNNVIFPQTRSKLVVENLSLGGTGSEFYTFCLQNFLPQNDQPDIVLIELSVNDYGYLHGATAKPMELLTRRVLYSFQSPPLVLYVSLVDLVKKGYSLKSIQNPYCHNLEDLGQRELAKHYEITLLSWRDILCPVNSQTRKRQAYVRPGMVNRDHLHIDVKGHAQVALMLIRYFQNSLQRATLGVAYGPQPQCMNSTGGISPPLFADASLLVTNPLCWAYVNPGWRKSAVYGSLQVTVKREHKFEELPMDSIKAKMGYNGTDDRTDAFGGWMSVRQGSFIEFAFQVPAAYKYGNAPNTYSVGIVMRRLFQNSGQVKMWLDNNKKTAVTITGKTFGKVHFQTRVYFVAPDVSPGHHTVSLETIGNKVIGLLISGVVLGPGGIRGFEGYKPIGTLEKVWSREDFEKFKL